MVEQIQHAHDRRLESRNSPQTLLHGRRKMGTKRLLLPHPSRSPRMLSRSNRRRNSLSLRPRKRQRRNPHPTTRRLQNRQSQSPRQLHGTHRRIRLPRTRNSMGPPKLQRTNHANGRSRLPIMRRQNQTCRPKQRHTMANQPYSTPRTPTGMERRSLARRTTQHPTS